MHFHALLTLIIRSVNFTLAIRLMDERRRVRDKAATSVVPDAKIIATDLWSPLAMDLAKTMREIVASSILTTRSVAASLN